jgi:hypothetical protein
LRSLREKKKLHAKDTEEVAKPDFSAFSAENFAFSARKKEASRKGRGGSRKTGFLCVLCEKLCALGVKKRSVPPRRQNNEGKDAKRYRKLAGAFNDAEYLSFSHHIR